MSHNFQQTEGIILRATPFRDYDHIVTLFTLSVGVMKLMVHGNRNQRGGVQGLCVPLTKVEVIYREKGGEIFNCQEMTLIEPYAHLRKELSHLETGCELLNAVCSSQMSGKPAPLLYELLCFFLERIPSALCPPALTVSFRLKLLAHDGLAAFPWTCSECGQWLLTEAFTRESEAWCSDHRPIGSYAWDQTNLEQLYRFVGCQSFREISSETVSTEVQIQTAHFFDACLKI